MISMLAIFTCGLGCTSTYSPPEDNVDPIETAPVLNGLRGSEGAVLWLEEGELGERRVEVREGDGSWSELSTAGTTWQDPDAGKDHSYRLYHPGYDIATSPLFPPFLHAELSLAQDLLMEGEPLELMLTVEGSGDHLLGVEIFAAAPSDEVKALCHSDFMWAVEDVLLSEALPLPELLAAATDASLCALGVAVHAPAGGGVLSVDSVTFIELGYSLAWGDVHAHSNLSNDGCELPEAGCFSRSGEAAGDFFDNGLDRGLDFAAITDHAEYAQYIPHELEEPVSIWAAQLDAVRNAEGSDLIPLIGYEWSNASGHKTVLFESPDICLEYRVSSREEADIEDFHRMGKGDTFIAGNPVVGTSGEELWSALDRAGERCELSRALTFFHHTAMTRPRSVDWAEAESVPDERYETVVEITSEHGTSECFNLKQEHCDYRIKEGVDYIPAGSIQYALSLGYRLGFVAGTDSHDSSPGSIDDGPSAISYGDNQQSSDITFHDYAGGLTGVMHSGPLTRTSLFDAFFLRNTIATTGPRLDARVALLDDQGRVYLPGDVVEVDSGPFLLQVAVDELPGSLTVLGIELIDPVTGELLSVSGTATLDVEVPLESGDAPYLRIRIEDSSGEEERMWLSPFFGGA